MIKRQVSNVIMKMSKDEGSGLNCKLESMEENQYSPEVEISAMPGFGRKVVPIGPTCPNDPKKLIQNKFGLCCNASFLVGKSLFHT